MRFSDKLYKQRKNNNMSQEQLADRLGVSRQAVSKWESGSSYPDMDKIIQMCNILNCTLEELLDDGIIKDDKTNNQTSTKNNFNNYLNDFLSFITKSFNMFCSMTLKEKIKFLFEMFFIIIIVFIIGTIVSCILNLLITNILSIVPKPIFYYLHNIIETIYLSALFILGLIIVIHLFKIRYLDYYVTIEDQNVKEKKIEKSIEKIENENSIKKQKIIIRDPKHSTFSFINFLGKIILFIIKFFSLFIVIPTIVLFIIFVFIAILSIYHITYGNIFFYIFVAVLGMIAICYILIEFIYRFLFDIKQNFNKLFIIFIISLILIGVGSSLSFSKIINYNYTKNIDNLTLITSEEYIDIDDNTYIYLEIPEDNIQYVIDNSLDNIKLEIEYPNNIEYSLEYYISKDEQKNIKHYYFHLTTINPFNLYKLVLNDLKNNTIRNYNTYNLLKIKVYLSEINYDKLRNDV